MRVRKNNFAILVSCLSFLLLLHLSAQVFCVNLTESMPRGLYRSKFIKTTDNDLVGKTVTVQQGFAEKVQKKLHYHGFPIQKFIKKVYGKAGDVVDYDKKRKVITINGQVIKNTEIKQVGGDGKPLPQMNYPYVISEDRYWIGTERKDSYDSRYFGTVARQAIQCEAYPLLVEKE